MSIVQGDTYELNTPRRKLVDRLIGFSSNHTGSLKAIENPERLAVDPAIRHVVGGRAAEADNEPASMSVVGRFETEMLSERRNLTALMNLSSQWIDKAHQHQTLRELILDLDSSVSETYGEQEGSAYNGHFKCLCYHTRFTEETLH